MTAYLNPNHYLGPKDHEYSLDVEMHYETGTITRERDLRVNARAREQARRIAEREGYVVRSINMIA